MKLQQLRCLLAVVDASFNITLAAERLFATQPGVSKTLAQLEEELGFPLFERRGRVLIGLTNPAREVVNRARKVLREIENIKTVAADWRLEDQGRLCIATNSLLARYLLPSVLRRFRERYPRIAIDIRLGRHEQLAHWLERGEADVALACGSIAGFEALTRFDCESLPYQLHLPVNHPLTLSQGDVTPAELAAYPLWIFDHEGSQRLCAELATALGPIAQYQLCSDITLLHEQVTHGTAIGLCPMAASSAPPSSATIIRTTAFPPLKNWVALKNDAVLRRHTMNLILQLCPQLTEREILGHMGAEDYKTIMYYI